MIKNRQYMERFERELVRTGPPDVRKNFKLVDAMYAEAVEMGIIPMKDPLDGLETDIRVATVVNHVSKSPHNSS